MQYVYRVYHIKSYYASGKFLICKKNIDLIILVQYDAYKIKNGEFIKWQEKEMLHYLSS